MWNRGYIPKLRTGELPWAPIDSLAPGFAPGTSVRVLSRDLANGASTCLWKIPPGWQHPRSYALELGEALFVLDGELSKGGERYRQGFYSYRPRGFVHEPMQSSEGAIVLAMWDGDLQMRRPIADVALNEEPVLCIDTGTVTGVPTFVEGPVPGITVKLLRTDKRTGGMTLLISIPSGWTEARSEHHHCVEESFKTAGEIQLTENGQDQTLAAGDYFFRPPRIKHGPMHTPRGTTSLIRFSAKVENYYGPLDADI
jgi:anti-sigma factor ChrR (cupin superfamily)